MEGNYNGRKFVGKSNTSTGEVGADTIFEYFQSEEILKGTYKGGDILSGHLIGKVLPDGRLNFVYHHINASGELKAGECESTPERLPDGRIRLYESWKWFGGEKGKSVIEEVLG